MILASQGPTVEPKINILSLELATNGWKMLKQRYPNPCCELVTRYGLADCQISQATWRVCVAEGPESDYLGALLATSGCEQGTNGHMNTESLWNIVYSILILACLDSTSIWLQFPTRFVVILWLHHILALGNLAMNRTPTYAKFEYHITKVLLFLLTLGDQNFNEIG